jgi:serine/threonine protein kinase
LLALDYLHCRKVVLRDIKLDNILINKIDEGELKVIIADFGLAVLVQPGIPLYEKSGTPCYMAPEILRDEGYGTKCDIFSLGSVYFNLITGAYLFNGANQAEVLQKNTACDLTLIKNYLAHTSPECQDLLMLML